ncbi:ANR52 phosphatase, partial [Loxia curvirostra]|nr:ANR52 phosphatase [Loxia curvirostra]
QSKEGKSPLHMAAIHGRFTRSQILIQNGREIDCADRFGNTPLHVAARYGHELLISTLMTNGADTARRGIHDMFPLHLAVLFGFSDCCRKLLSSGQLYSIVSSLSNEHVLSAGFDINTPDNLGRTCLHAAASGGWHLRVLPPPWVALGGTGGTGRARWGAPGDTATTARGAPGGTGGTATSLRCHPGALSVTQVAPGGTARAPWGHQGHWRQPEVAPGGIVTSPSCLEFLLDNGADPSLRDKQGYTAVHYAAAYGNRQNLELV